MTLKLGLMHTPKPAGQTTTILVDSCLPLPAAGAVEGPIEFLMRIREAQHRARSGRKGVCVK